MKIKIVLAVMILLALKPVVAADEIKVLGLEVLKPTSVLIEDLLTKAGYKSSFDYVPFARFIATLKRGTFELAFVMAANELEEVPDYEIIPVPVYFNEFFVYSIDSKQKAFDISKLSNKVIAYVRGYRGIADLLQNARNVEEVGDEVQGFKMLGAGRVDYFIASRASGKIFGGHAKKPVSMLEPSVFKSNLYIVVRKGHEKLKLDLQIILEKKVKDGSWGRQLNAIFASMGQ